MTEDLLDNTRRAYDNRLGFGRHPALLIIDFVHAYFDPDCDLFADVQDALDSALRVRAAARQAGLPVIYTNVVYHPSGINGGRFFQKAMPLRHFTEGNPMGAWAAGLAACAAGLIWSDRIVSLADAAFFEDNVILAEETPYQRIVVTEWRGRYRLFLNGSIQFDTLDEHRYHEALVHPVMSRLKRRADVLILGGGDGMAVREVLRWDGVERVTLVDLDPRVTELFRDTKMLASLNDNALNDPRVSVVNEDAWNFVREGQELYDLIILDLPDPRDFAVSKLYSREFYAPLMQRIAARGAIVTQAGSQLFAREAFWSVARTVSESPNPLAPGQTVHATPYHTYVPSFGDWGFVAASAYPVTEPPASLPEGLRYFEHDLWPAMTTFAGDTGPVEVEANSILSHSLVTYYEDGWRRWMN